MSAVGESITVDRYVVNEAGCWIGAGAPNHSGYAKVSFRGKQILAHRWSVIVRDGSIPPGMEVDHLCHNRDPKCRPASCTHRMCINPDHLEVVPHAENMRRARGSRAYCRNGHARTPEATFTNADGRQVCNVCRLASKRRYRARKRPPQISS